MKKILLSGFIAISGLMSAQYETGFEQSEGFSDGNLGGQGSWVAQQEVLIDAVITSSKSKSGSQSFKFTGTGTNDDENPVYVGRMIQLLDTTVMVVSFDFFYEDGTDAWTAIQAIATDNFYTTFLYLAPNMNDILALQPSLTTPGSLSGDYAGATNFIPDVWNNVKMVINKDDGEINYYINDVLATTTAMLSGMNIQYLFIENDNWSGNSYIDNLKIYDAATAGVNDIKKSLFSVFPNPTADFLNVASKSKVESAQVYDLSGKAVKVSVANNQIDVRNLAKGSYVVKIQTAEGASTQKFIKK